MMTPTTPVARTPLSEATPLDGVMSLRERPLSGKISVRGDATETGFIAALSASFGGLPTQVGEQATTDGVSLVCLGPDEWRLHCHLGDVDTEIARLQGEFAPGRAAAVDVSDYYTELELGGKHTRDVLAKLTPLDVSRAGLAAGSMVATRMAKCSVVLHLVQDDLAVLQVRWSHAQYLWDYLIEATREYNA